jgi:hypothetical protein
MSFPFCFLHGFLLANRESERSRVAKQNTTKNTQQGEPGGAAIPGGRRFSFLPVFFGFLWVFFGFSSGFL